MSIYDPYTTTSAGRSPIELDLRKELENLLRGASDEIAKGRTGLLRVMRIGSDGEPVRCLCRDRITDEPDRDYYCRSCFGHGYFWDEHKIVYYKNDESSRTKDDVDFYIEYDETITYRDFIVEVNVDEDGDLVTPYERIALYEIKNADPFRADRGRIEFWHIKAKRRRDWSTWYGIKHRQYG